MFLKIKIPKVYKLTNTLNHMKQVNVHFTDEEFELLIKEKKDLNWHDFILRKDLNKEKEVN